MPYIFDFTSAKYLEKQFDAGGSKKKSLKRFIAIEQNLKKPHFRTEVVGCKISMPV
jgi:hypothetical protein